MSKLNPRFKMVEIYKGKDPEWQGFHNLILETDDLNVHYSIAGPLDPKVSKLILEAIK